jgi:ribonuclease D
MFKKKIIHNLVFEFALIENQQDLNNFLELIKEDSVIAIDTEFTRRTTYYPILSTIQIALKKLDDSKIIVIIDALQSLDLSALINKINNPQIFKILHSSLQDLQIFHHISKNYPQNICDTQIMANFCQKDFNVGYSSLVKEIFEIEISKEMQISNWQSRPLSKNQIDYAVVDVLFLHEIYENFLKLLKINNQVSWFEEEMRDFVNKSLDQNNKNLMRQISTRGKSNKQIAQLHNLVLLREKFAQIQNIPREHLLKIEDIEKIVENSQDFNFHKLNLKNIFIDEIKKILKIDDNFVDNNEDLFMNEDHKKILNQIKSLISKKAQKYKIKEQFLLSGNQIKRIVKFNKIVDEMNNWRYEILGKEIETLLKNYENNCS